MTDDKARDAIAHSIAAWHASADAPPHVARRTRQSFTNWGMIRRVQNADINAAVLAAGGPLTPTTGARLMAKFNPGKVLCSVNAEMMGRLTSHERSVIEARHCAQGQKRSTDAWWQHSKYWNYLSMVGQWARFNTNKRQAAYRERNRDTINAKKRAARRDKRIVDTFNELRDIANKRGGTNEK